MSEFTIKTKMITGNINDLEDIEQNVQSISHQIDSVISRLVVQGVSGALIQIMNELEGERRSFVELIDALEEINQLYINHENGILNGKTVSQSEKQAEANKSMLIEKLEELFMNAMGNTGSGGAMFAPYFQLLKALIEKGEIGADLIAKLTLASPVNFFSTIAEISLNSEGIADTMKEIWGLSGYWDEIDNVTSSVTDDFIRSLKKEISEFVDFEDLTKGANAVAKWANVIVSGIGNFAENYEEFGDEVTVRGVSETAIETGIDFGLDLVATATVAAFIGPGAPVIAVAVAGTAITVGANWLCEAVTGKDIGENIADFACDTVEYVSNMINDGFEYFVSWAF